MKRRKDWRLNTLRLALGELGEYEDYLNDSAMSFAGDWDKERLKRYTDKANKVNATRGRISEYIREVNGE